MEDSSHDWPPASLWTLGARLDFALKRAKQQRGLTMEMVAEQLGITKSAVSQWRKSSMIDKHRLAPLSRILDCPPVWLLMGEPVSVSGAVRDQHAVYNNPRVRMVPVISFTQAGSWVDSADPYEAGHGSHYEPVPDVGPHAFIVEVEGASMEPKISAGTMVVVDPDVSPRSGDFVVAKRDNERSTLKRYEVDGERHFLVPVNPQFPTLEMREGDRIVGVVVRKIENLLRERRR